MHNKFIDRKEIHHLYEVSEAYQVRYGISLLKASSSQEAFVLAYLIIGIELAILYTVFWYVFLREPRPYKIKENIWGYYPGFGGNTETLAQNVPEAISERANQYTYDPRGNSFKECCQCSEHQAQTQEALQNSQAIKSEWQVDPENQVKRYFHLIRSQSKGVEGFVDYSSNQVQVKSTDAYQGSKFLAKLGESLNTANVRIP